MGSTIVPTINWGSTGHGDFSICNKDNTSGYLIGSDFNSIAGTLASAYLNRWYMWQYKDDKLVVSKLQEWKFPWGYLPPGIIMHNGKIIIAAESLDRAGEVCSTVINDPKKNYALKPISKERGEYPILAKKGDTVVLTFARFEGYYRDVTRAKLFMTTSKDGLTWTSPRSIINSTGIIQANQVIDENGNIFILFSTISHELRASVPANYNYSCGLQATRITTLWLTWSNDNGASFQEPVKVTEGINADHYPEIAIIEKHLRLFWTRYTSTKPDDPYSGIIAGNIITSNYGLTSEIIK